MPTTSWFKDLHTKENLIDACDGAIVRRKAEGKVMLGKKHETPTRVGGVLGVDVGPATSRGRLIPVRWPVGWMTDALSSG